MSRRREFTRDQREQIVDRARNDTGQICCEGCRQVLGLKAYEIDHIIAEALRPDADKKRKLTIAEGQLLGKDCCHRGPDGKTAKDVKAISKAKAVSARHHGYGRKPKAKIASPPKAAKRPPKPQVQNNSQLFRAWNRTRAEQDTRHG